MPVSHELEGRIQRFIPRALRAAQRLLQRTIKREARLVREIKRSGTQQTHEAASAQRGEIKFNAVAPSDQRTNPTFDLIES